MWVCEICGQPCDDKDKECSMCTTEQPKQTAKKAGTVPAVRTFEFNEDAKPPAPPPIAEEPESSETPEAIAATAETENETDETELPAIGDRLIVTIAGKLARAPRFWMISGAIVLGFIIVPWSISQIIKLTGGPALDYHANAVEPELKKKLEVIIKDVLPDKLEWAQEHMRLRLPTRFPEELTMDANQAEAEVKYDNKEKNSAYYRMLVCYHFVDAHKKTYFWQPVTFFFEIRNGAWTMIGDRWIRKSEIIFE
ncbi:hypothetical protein KAR34_13840 [bacterium]|nr:hypothetical protein [bacterium]